MRKQVSRDVLLNWWLNKYHNTSVDEIVNKYDKEFLKTGNWFELFPVTEEQKQEWILWAKDYIRKETKISKKLLDREWGFIYLDCAPSTKKKEE